MSDHINLKTGACGSIQFVKRWRVIQANGAPAHPSQGRFMMSKIKAIEVAGALGDDFRIEAWWCWPNHHDPAVRCVPVEQSSVDRSPMRQIELTSMNKCPRVVVCAAAKHKTTCVMICGPRHGECINQVIALGIDPDPGPDWELGFVDQDNRFMTREDAWIVADFAGQIRRPTGYETNFEQTRKSCVNDRAPLFSENLY